MFGLWLRFRSVKGWRLRRDYELGAAIVALDWLFLLGLAKGQRRGCLLSTLLVASANVSHINKFDVL